MTQTYFISPQGLTVPFMHFRTRFWPRVTPEQYIQAVGITLLSSVPSARVPFPYLSDSLCLFLYFPYGHIHMVCLNKFAGLIGKQFLISYLIFSTSGAIFTCRDHKVRQVLMVQLYLWETRGAKTQVSTHRKSRCPRSPGKPMAGQKNYINSWTPFLTSTSSQRTPHSVFCCFLHDDKVIVAVSAEASGATKGEIKMYHIHHRINR